MQLVWISHSNSPIWIMHLMSLQMRKTTNSQIKYPPRSCAFVPYPKAQKMNLSRNLLKDFFFSVNEKDGNELESMDLPKPPIQTIHWCLFSLPKESKPQTIHLTVVLQYLTITNLLFKRKKEENSPIKIARAPQAPDKNISTCNLPHHSHLHQSPCNVKSQLHHSLLLLSTSIVKPQFHHQFSCIWLTLWLKPHSFFIRYCLIISSVTTALLCQSATFLFLIIIHVTNLFLQCSFTPSNKSCKTNKTLPFLLLEYKEIQKHILPKWLCLKSYHPLHL